MVSVLLEEVLKLADQLNDDEQAELIEKLESRRAAKKRPALELPILDLGPWPEDLSLRREDWYDDNGR